MQRVGLVGVGVPHTMRFVLFDLQGRTPLSLKHAHARGTWQMNYDITTAPPQAHIISISYIVYTTFIYMSAKCHVPHVANLVSIPRRNEDELKVHKRQKLARAQIILA